LVRQTFSTITEATAILQRETPSQVFLENQKGNASQPKMEEEASERMGGLHEEISQ